MCWRFNPVLTIGEKRVQEEEPGVLTVLIA
jgi:hypothetical protein